MHHPLDCLNLARVPPSLDIYYTLCTHGLFKVFKWSQRYFSVDFDLHMKIQFRGLKHNEQTIFIIFRYGHKPK